jgi:outer membrane lipoprotein-sorting protein
VNFSEPRDQVIVIDGVSLQVYLPRQSVTMRQALPRHNEAGLAAMASAQGLNLLMRSYAISYMDSPNLVPLEAGSRERVRKFRLVWRSTEEGFRQIIISVGENGYIRRMEGITKEYQEIRYDFTNIIINQGIPDARFTFDAPSSSYTSNNFLFEPES